MTTPNGPATILLTLCLVTVVEGLLVSQTTVSRYLVAYSFVVTLAFIGSVIYGVRAASRTSFKDLEVERLNIVEPDGSLRLVISNRARFPGAIIRGQEFPHESRRDVAGMLFYNDEKTENGGLIFNGQKKADQKPSAGLSLTFDKYEQDQLLQLAAYEQNGQEFSGLVISDRPERSIKEDFSEHATIKNMPENERNALMEKRYKEGYYGAERVFLGKKPDRSTSLILRDPEGRKRIVMKVPPTGAATLEFYDEKGDKKASYGP